MHFLRLGITVQVGHSPHRNLSIAQGREILGKVCWITQLVVHRDARQRGIATFLLQSLKRPEHTAFGLASSHPAACLAALHLGRQYFMFWFSDCPDKVVGHIGADPLHLNLTFTKSKIHEVVQTSSVEYVRTAEPQGSLFEDQGGLRDDAAKGAVCTLYTSFFIDRAEPTAALAQWKAKCGGKASWPLGDLPEGHEYLVLVKAPPLDI
jgi:hypothetical protein